MYEAVACPLRGEDSSTSICTHIRDAELEFNRLGTFCCNGREAVVTTAEGFQGRLEQRGSSTLRCPRSGQSTLPGSSSFLIEAHQ